MSIDAAIGPVRLLDLAQIYAMTGEQDAAINQLEKLLLMPGIVSAAWLRTDPVWNPLLQNPRFGKLVAEKK